MDLIQTHNKVLKILDDKIRQTGDLENTIKIYEEAIKNSKNVIEITELENKIKSCREIINQSTRTKNFYLCDVLYLITEYKELQQPTIINFNKLTEKNDCLSDILDRYILIANKYVDMGHYMNMNIKGKADDDLVCESCNKKMSLIEDEYICVECGLMTNIKEPVENYKDSTRITKTISMPAKYNIKTNLINVYHCFMGRENCKSMPMELHQKVINFCDMLKITVESLTKKQLDTIMKNNKFTKHYCHLNKYHSELTGTPLPIIPQYIEDMVLRDIDILHNTYHKIYKKHKQFINSQLVICFLLTRNGYKCSLKDFNTLRTEKRLYEHKQIFYTLESHLGWRHTNLK